MNSGVFTFTWKEIIKQWERESRIRFGTSQQKTTSGTVHFPVITATEIGPNGKSFSSSGMYQSRPWVFESCGDTGRNAMSKGIELSQGGKWGFSVAKLYTADDVERFTVSFAGATIVYSAPWAEAGQVMNNFKDELDDAFNALVELSTLTPSGAHEDS